MKQRYEESFLFPQGAEDFGRSLVFPQGQLHGLSGLGAMSDAVMASLQAQLASSQSDLQNTANQISQLQAQLPNLQFPNVLSLDQGIAFLQAQGLYAPGMPREAIVATVHALSPDAYVSGGGTGYGSAEGVQAQFEKTLATIDQLNQVYQSILQDINGINANIAYRPTAIALEQAAAEATARGLEELKKRQAAAAAEAAAQQDAATRAAAKAAADQAAALAAQRAAAAQAAADQAARDAAAQEAAARTLAEKQAAAQAAVIAQQQQAHINQNKQNFIILVTKY
jgi:hypothetical protein